MFKVWCEWDYGQDDSIFSTRENAMAYIEKIVLNHDDDCVHTQDMFGNAQNMLDSGLVGIIPVALDPTEV